MSDTAPNANAGTAQDKYANNLERNIASSIRTFMDHPSPVIMLWRRKVLTRASPNPRCA
jgi:hypothetical protein